jgi:SAM-dependent methyltransferase
MESVLTSDSSDAVELRQVEQAPARALCDAASPEKLVASLYRSILQREADHGGIAQKLQLIEDGASLEWLITILLQSPEYLNKVARDPLFIDAAMRTEEVLNAFRMRMGLTSQDVSSLFPRDYTGNGEAGKFYRAYRNTGFFEKFLSGEKVLDIGYKGYDNPNLLTIVPHAIGIDFDYPGYDGSRLPFDDGSIDTVYSSHCLEHIDDYEHAIRDWYRVLKVGGHIVCAVPSQLLYEKKRNPPSRYNLDHKRFYTPRSLVAEFEQALQENSYRVRFLEENDRGYNYDIGPERHALGCYEIVIAVEKIRQLSWRLGED